MQVSVIETPSFTNAAIARRSRSIIHEVLRPEELADLDLMHQRNLRHFAEFAGKHGGLFIV
jgi:hypothetical protein